MSLLTHLVVCAIEDPGVPNPLKQLTILGQNLRQVNIILITSWSARRCQWNEIKKTKINKKNKFWIFFSISYPRNTPGFSKRNASPAVRPTTRNIYTHVLFYYIDDDDNYDSLNLHLSKITKYPSVSILKLIISNCGFSFKSDFEFIQQS